MTVIPTGKGAANDQADKLAADVKAAARAEEAQAAGKREKWPAPGQPPAPPDARLLDPALVDEAYHLEHLGDGMILQALFRGRYLCDSQAAGRAGDRFKHVYKFNGQSWQLDTAHSYRVEFMAALGDAYKHRAGAFYEKAKELEERLADLLADPEASDYAKKEADKEAKAARKTGDAFSARGKKCLAIPRMLHAADAAFSGPEALGLPYRVEWNDHPSWLPCANGTIDLSTGRLMASKPEHYFNRCLPWEFKGLHAPCPVWQDTVAKVLGGDAEMIDYVEYIVGAAATGFQTKDFIVAIGETADNGKSLFFGTIARVLGDFAVCVDVDMLLKQTSRSAGAAHPETLRLRYARFVHTQEADSSDVLDVGKVKMYSAGGDAIAVRTLHSDIYHLFNQTHTMIIHTNKAPRLYEGDKGLARRLRMLPFRSQFRNPAEGPENPAEGIFHARDRAELERIFESEMSGILGWMVRCAIKFLANSRRLPPAPPMVVAESADYMTENDIVEQFIEAKCKRVEGFNTVASALYRDFKLWCEEEKDMEKKEIISSTRFGRQIKGHVKSHKVHGVVVYKDISVL